MKFLSIVFLSLFISASVLAQDKQDSIVMHSLPYHQIPEAPEKLNASNIMSRMVDGLGYRYYWATENLRSEDLAWKPSEDGKTVAETIDHVYGLSKTILNAAQGKPNIRSSEPAAPTKSKELSDLEKRAEALKNFKAASDHFRSIDPNDLQNSKVIFQRGENTTEFPVWNLINGPISDAIYHAGQIVAFRRASGNPVDSGMSVFIGKTKKP